MKRPAFILLLTVLAAVLLLQASPSLPAVADPAPLTWDGKALTGQPYYERVFDQMTIHYTKPTRADIVEKYHQELLPQLNWPGATWDPLLPGERLHVWVVPRDQARPLGLDPAAGPFQAVAPRTVVVSGDQLPEPDRLGVFAGFSEVIAVAMTQPEGSPAYSVRWLRNGYGRAMSVPLRDFPGGFYQSGYERLGITSVSPALEAPYVLEQLAKHDGSAAYSVSDASGAVVGLLIDRWGVNWWEYYPGNVAELTPAEAIRWATDAADDAEAQYRFEVRMQQALRFQIAAKKDANVGRSIALVDQGKNRLTPVLRTLPVSGSNRSPHAYRFDVSWDPAARTVAGDEVLTWNNGEGVPIDRLYFNLWGNTTGALWYRGFTAVDAVSVDGEAAAFQAKGMDLEVPLGREVQPGEQVTVNIRFRTRLPGSRPNQLSLWYPALARLDEAGWHLDSFPPNGKMIAEAADYEVHLSVPHGIAPTVPESAPTVTENGDRRVYRFTAKNLTEWSATLVTEP